MKKVLFLTLVLCVAKCAFSQKTTYIPLYLRDTTDVNGAQFTWDKTYEDSNFIVIWGNTVGTNPAAYTADTNLRFDPAVILDTMEYIYHAYKALGFLNDSPGTHLSQYKVPIIIYNTWGTTGQQGYANGGDADGIIGAYWVHPIAMHGGHVAAHEFTHSLQAEVGIDYRTTYGYGPVWNYAPIFWETHANFMRNLLYPQDVSAYGMEDYHELVWGDWKNTYENYELLMAIMATDGIDAVNDLWRRSLSSEYPLQAYKRLNGYSQAAFNDKMYGYVRRMPTFDLTYNNEGAFFRAYHAQDMVSNFLSIQAAYNIMKQTVVGNHYEMPIEQAPEEYGYNVIPLYQNPDSCSVIIKFKGHTEINGHAGWRYGFVTEYPDGTVSRYSDIYKDNEATINFALQSDERKMYLVVMGAPVDRITTDTTNDTWHGYPKHYRFPYELTISGAVPEGFQEADSFRAQLKTDGHIHPNGGGWVQNSAAVDNTVYVATHAIVMGNAVITGNVRIDNTALVNEATINGNVHVLDDAFVNTGTYADNVVIKGRAYANNNVMSDSAILDMRANVANYNLSGNIEVGGDVQVYNDTGNCNNGVYYRMTNYYQDNLLECDGRTANYITNLDVNNTYSSFSDAQMALNCDCALLPNCLTATTASSISVTSIDITAQPNPASEIITFKVTSSDPVNNMEITVYNAIGAKVATGASNNNETSIKVNYLPDGMYLARVKVNNDAIQVIKIVVAK